MTVGFRKVYASPEAAATARWRSQVARAAGVPTPAVLGEEGAEALVFDRIMAQGQPGLPEMVGLLTTLRAMPVEGLARHDPFRRILPRLRTAPPKVAALVVRLRARDANLAWPASGVVHGDFHPGQVLRDAKGKHWLVDLDDLALAPPEADLGNLAAWQATQAPGHLKDQSEAAQGMLLALAPQADPRLLAHFCDIALVRRALKLAERDVPWALSALAV
jgi:hypothetical protein